MSRIELFLKHLFSLALFCFPLLLQAQSGFVVRGTITEKGTGEALIGVNIIEKNENNRFLNGTISDIMGNFTLEVSNPNAKLQFSFIGYQPTTEMVNGRNVINVVMEQEAQKIQGVTVTGKRTQKELETGYGSISRRDMTGSVSQVNLAEIEESPVATLDEMLQGRAAGVQAVANSGDPGSGFTIRIRGTSSFMAGNDPLYIVDGVPIIAERSESGLSDHEFNPLSDIDPEDIASINILKDASATAIYGSRAANGVVVITTKRGEKGKTAVSFSSKLSVTQAPGQIPMLDGESYKMLMLEADQFRGGDVYSEEVQKHLRDDPNDPDFELHNNNTNWMDEITQLGFSQQYNFAIRGGGETTRYSFSTGYTDQTGTAVNTGFQRFTTRFNLDYKISDKFRFGSGISYSNSSTNKKDVTTKGIPGVQSSAQLADPSWPVYDQDEWGNSKPNYAIRNWVDENEDAMSNPYAFIREVDSRNKNNRFTGTVFSELDLFKGFRWKTQFSTDLSIMEDGFFIPPEATGKMPGDVLDRYNKVKLVDSESMRLSLENVFTYHNIFNEIHALDLLCVQSIQDDRNSKFYGGGTNAASVYLPDLSNTAQYLENVDARKKDFILSSDNGESALTSITGRIQYKLKDRYLVTATVRQDGSSKFGKESRYAVLPAFAGSWRVSSEPFMESVESVNDLKLRFSWGMTGNGNIGNYKYISRYSSGGSNHYLGDAGVRASNIRLDNLSWETTKQLNAGFDLTMFQNRMTINADYFVKRTYDMLWNNNTLPTTSGFSSLYVNSGDVENRGVELTMDARIINRQDFTWNFNFNVSTLRNKVLSLPEGGALEGSGRGLASKFKWRIEEGAPVGAIYGYRFKGVYSRDEDAVVCDASGETVYNMGGKDETKDFNNAKIMRYNGYSLEGGDAIYEDLNNDGIIDDMDITQIGDANPDFFGGFTNRFSYKNLVLSVFFQFQAGNDIVNAIRLQTEGMGNLDNQSTATLRRWRKQGDVTDIPKAGHQYKSSYNYLGSSRFVEDGSYLRLKTINLSYNVPKKIRNKLKLQSLKLFVTGSNLYTCTKYIGADPEIFKNLKKEELGLKGVDDSRTPVPMVYTFGINASF